MLLLLRSFSANEMSKENHTDENAAMVSLDGLAPHALQLGRLQAVWAYLGQGYRTNDDRASNGSADAPAPCVEVDVSSLRTRVVRSQEDFL